MSSKNKSLLTPVKHFLNTGKGYSIFPVDIGHPDYLAVIDPDTAFWALVKHAGLGNFLTGKSNVFKTYLKKRSDFSNEMKTLRFKLTPSAVYFNPTERCNLNCAYCYIPEKMRKNGPHMSKDRLLEALQILKDYFRKTVPQGRLPQIVFHGSEPMMNKEAVFTGIKKFAGDFAFGIQSNAVFLDNESIDFLKEHKVGIGISLDGPDEKTANRIRKDWQGKGAFNEVLQAIRKLSDYPALNVICTITTENMKHLVRTVDFFHNNGVSLCMFNIVRCTQPKARTVKPDDETAAAYYLRALDRTYEIYRKTGRKLVVANFANILLAIIAPSARRLMCDISPCGGGRCFFAVSANGDIFPCSEFVGLAEFKGGNLFNNNISDILNSKSFKMVTERLVENISPCRTCAIRHFCGAPCPAEAYAMNGGRDELGAFCGFYEEQARYAMRLIADGKENAYLWDNWDTNLETVFDSLTLC